MRNFNVYINGIRLGSFSLIGETARNYYKYCDAVRQYVKHEFNISSNDFEIYEVI